LFYCSDFLRVKVPKPKLFKSLSASVRTSTSPRGGYTLKTLEQ